MMRTRKKAAMDKANSVTSPLVNVESNPSVPGPTEPFSLTTTDPGPPAPKSPQPTAAQGADHRSPCQQPKHGRDTDAEVSAPSTCQPPAKRTKVDTTSPVKSSSNVPGPPRARIIIPPRSRNAVPPRSPLPQRLKRVVNPGAPDQKRVHRTTEEVAAATKRKVQLILDLEKVQQEKVRMMAEIEAEVEEEERLEEEMAIRHITDLPGSHTKPRDDNVAMMASEEEDVPKGIDPVEEVQEEDTLERPAKLVSNALTSKMSVTHCLFPQKKKARAKARVRGDVRVALDKKKEEDALGLGVKKKNDNNALSKSRHAAIFVKPSHASLLTTALGHMHVKRQRERQSRGLLHLVLFPTGKPSVQKLPLRVQSPNVPAAL